jgi:hypothetical protein
MKEIGMVCTSNMCRPWLLAAAAGLAFSTSAIAQVNNPEVEPNEVKGTATVAASGGGGMANMDFITGNSTGSSTSTAGAASADTFRVKTAGAALGIYRHRLQITTTGTSGHGGTIRGLSQGSTGIGTGDNTFQSSSTLTTPTRFNQWYGFGKGEEIYYRVTGTGSTTSDYVSTLETTPVALSSDILSGVEAGAVTVTSVGQGHTTDTEVWVYDSNLDAIPGFGNDDEFGTTSTQSKVTRTMAAGTYYVAITNFAFANNQASPSDDDFRTGTVLDFPNAAANSSTSTGVNVAFAFISPVGTLAVAGTRAGPYDINWVRFAVSPAVTPTNPTITATTATPSSADNCGTANIVVTATVSPGAAPPSTGLAVSVDASAVLGGTVNLLDNGVAPDATAGDNVFSGTVTVGAGATVGTQALTFNAVDAELRSATPSNRNVTITVCPPPPPGCPTGDVIFSLPAMTSTAAAGGVGNSISVQNTASTQIITKLRMTGRYTEVNAATIPTEGRLRVTAPDGTIYNFGPFTFGFTGTEVPVIADVTTGAPFEAILPGGELATGNWTFETFESFDDSGLDGTWSPMCVALVADSLPPTITSGSGVAFNADSTPVGGTTINVSLTATNGVNPASPVTGVSIDGSSAGLGTINLVDPETDNIWTGTIDVTGATPGNYTFPVTATDGTRTGSSNFSVRVQGGMIALGTIGTENDGLLVDDFSSGFVGQVQWYSFSTSRTAAETGGVDPDFFFDIDTEGTVIAGSFNGNDSEIAVFNSLGSIEDQDDEDGSGSASQLTWGDTTNPRPPIGGGSIYNGRDGSLAAGTYYLAISPFNTDYAAPFSATNTSTRTGTIDVNFNTNIPVCDSIDFNGDGIFPDNQDIIDLIEVFAGGTCPTGTCQDLDFNNDGVFPDNGDITAFIIAFGGGGCP